MKIDQKILYHVGTNTEGCKMLDSKGEHSFDIHFKNFRYLDIINSKFEHKSKAYGELGWLKFLDKIYAERDALVLDDKNYKEQLLRQVNHYSYKLNARYWELIFESERKEIDINLPSRFSCIYLCDEDLKYWYEKALSEMNVEKIPVYKMEATGHIHHADSQWLELDILPDNEIKDIARKYWSGETTEDGKLDEYLFWGDIKILEKFNSIEDKNNRC